MRSLGRRNGGSMEGVVGSSSMSSSSMNLKKKLTILKFLAQSDIHPTPLNRPTIRQIHNKITYAIWKQIDATPHLWCKGHKLSVNEYLR